VPDMRMKTPSKVLHHPPCLTAPRGGTQWGPPCWPQSDTRLIRAIIKSFCMCAWPGEIVGWEIWHLPRMCKALGLITSTANKLIIIINDYSFATWNLELFFWAIDNQNTSTQKWNFNLYFWISPKSVK
jgi:hypothetical protein